MIGGIGAIGGVGAIGAIGERSGVVLQRTLGASVPTKG